jgi:hypothetical protein
MKRNVVLDAWYSSTTWHLIPNLVLHSYKGKIGRVTELEFNILCVTVLLTSKPKQLK